MKIRHVLAVPAALAATAAPALAHPGAGVTHGFTAGFLHPVGGLDHLLAMVAVGLLAAVLGGRALWLVPASFVGAMVAGSLVGLTGTVLPGVELMIGASVVVLGALVAFGQGLPVALAMLLTGGFAVFHGYAHAAGMPAATSAAAYGFGFVLATALLHGAGVALGLGTERLSRTVIRVGGGAIAAVGVALFVA
jgi:urease accessory protein